MAVVNSQSTAAYIFRTDYAGNVADTVMRMHPTLDMLLQGERPSGHDGNFVGSSFKYPMKFGNPMGISNQFTNAQGQASASKGVQFEAVAVTKYGLVLVDGPSILQCADDGAFTDLVRMTTDDTISAHVNHLAFDVFRSSSAIRGKRASISGNTVQLATIDDARNFEPDQTVGAAQNADGSSPRTGTTTVSAVDLSTGKITLANAAAITSFGDGDYLFNAGDPASTGGLGSMNGMEDSTPLARPVLGSDSFRGVDRGKYAERLAGTRLDTTTSSNQTIEENIGLSAIQVNSNGGYVTDATLNPINFWQVVRRGNAQVIIRPGDDLVFGFERARIATPAGTLVLHSDPDCPIDRCRGSNRDSHYVRFSGDGFVHVIMDDGNQSMRGQSADSVETRTRFVGQYIQNNTRNHFVFAI